MPNLNTILKQLEQFIGYISGCGGYFTSTVPVGKGEFLAWKLNQYIYYMDGLTAGLLWDMFIHIRFC